MLVTVRNHPVKLGMGDHVKQVNHNMNLLWICKKNEK